MKISISGLKLFRLHKISSEHLSEVVFITALCTSPIWNKGKADDWRQMTKWGLSSLHCRVAINMVMERHKKFIKSRGYFKNHSQDFHSGIVEKTE